MPAEKRRKKGVLSLFTGNAGIHRGDCFGEPVLIRGDDASVRMKKTCGAAKQNRHAEILRILYGPR